MQRILIVTGQSGSGKSSALQILEDVGFYCIDNLPLLLLPEIVEKIHQQQQVENLALGVDVRSSANFENFSQIVEKLNHYAEVEIVYFSTQTEQLISRFSLSRRPHPLSTRYSTLAECIDQEKQLLWQVRDVASLIIDSTGLGIHDLKHLLLHKLRQQQELMVVIQSFGFKYGVPLDTDYVFDVRHLPNPHWNMALRSQTGLDADVQEFLQGYPAVAEMIDDIQSCLNKWLPHLVDNHRHYVIISIGCTGGQHRSVYVVEQLRAILSKQWSVQAIHREHRKWES